MQQLQRNADEVFDVLSKAERCWTNATNSTEFECPATHPVEQALSTLNASRSALQQAAAKSGYTVILSTFNRDESAEELALYYASCPHIRQLDVVYHDPKREPPASLRNLGDRINTMASNVTYRLRHMTENKISNRFNVSGVNTAAVFSVDDDRKIPCRNVEEAFYMWLHLGPNALVLAFYDAVRWIDFRYPEARNTLYDWKSP